MLVSFKLPHYYLFFKAAELKLCCLIFLDLVSFMGALYFYLFICLVHVVGFAPGPVPVTDGSDGGAELQWNNGVEHKRKKLKEQDFLENNSQISSVDFFQPRSVSTGLGLSLDNNNNNNQMASSGDSALLSLIGDGIDHELQQQDVEIDRFLKVQVRLCGL